MKTTASRKPKQGESWPRKVTVGRETVSVYRRLTPLGNFSFMVANYSGKKRRFDCYASEAESLEAAAKLARRLSETDTKAAQMTEEQAVEYVNATRELQPLGITLTAAVAAIVQAVKETGDLQSVAAATAFYKAKHKKVTAKRVADAITEMLVLKQARGASVRYLRDLRSRMDRFAEKFPCNVGSVTTADLQAWLDGMKQSVQTYENFRRVLHLFFEFAVARGYALDNPAADVEKLKIRTGEIEIFTPDEARKLLAAAPDNFLPCLAIGLFAGLRSAEIERLEWNDVDLAQGHIVVGADKAKTATRRIVPIAENLAEWLKPYAKRTGKVWQGVWFYNSQQDTAKAAGLKWKANGMRHSFVTYSFALSADAGRVAGYAGNSPAIIHRHYRQPTRKNTFRSNR
jgi:integrase